MKEILIIDGEQFGDLVDYYKYCQYLNSYYSIKYLSFNKKHDIKKMDRIKYIDVPYPDSKILRKLLFISYVIISCFFSSGIIFIRQFKGCRIIPHIFPWKKIIMDIRTLSVNRDKNLRDIENYNTRLDLLSFKNVSFISYGIERQLDIPDHINKFYLPLGADVISNIVKIYDSLSLLYVGTLFNRHIEDSVIGFHKFLLKNPHCNITYTIIGSGPEADSIKSYISQHNLQNSISFVGRVNHDELGPFFDKCNVGVSYIPMTDYFDYQPPTKTFEYSFSGLITLATRTHANAEIINENNGILIDDNSDDFCRGLEELYAKRYSFSDSRVRASLENYRWDRLITNYFIPIIENSK